MFTTAAASGLAAANSKAQTINARCLRFHTRARLDANPPPKWRAGGLAVGVCRAPLAAASRPPAAGTEAEGAGAGRPPMRPRGSQPRGAAATRSGARVLPVRMRAPPRGGQVPLAMPTWRRPVVWMTRRGNGDGSNPPQIHGRRHGRSTRRRWSHPWAAPRRSRPRIPTSRTRRRHSSQPTSMSSRRKISRPRFFLARAE